MKKKRMDQEQMYIIIVSIVAIAAILFMLSSSTGVNTSGKAVGGNNDEPPPATTEEPGGEAEQQSAEPPTDDHAGWGPRLVNLDTYGECSGGQIEVTGPPGAFTFRPTIACTSQNPCLACGMNVINTLGGYCIDQDVTGGNCDPPSGGRCIGGECKLPDDGGPWTDEKWSEAIREHLNLEEDPEGAHPREDHTGCTSWGNCLRNKVVPEVGDCIFTIFAGSYCITVVAPIALAGQAAQGAWNSLVGAVNALKNFVDDDDNDFEDPDDLSAAESLAESANAAYNTLMTTQGVTWAEEDDSTIPEEDEGEEDSVIV